MESKLTHTEACKLVEELLDRMVKTLAYIRIKIDHPVYGIPDDGKPHRVPLYYINTFEEADLLCNINYYGAYLAGAKRMLMALKDHQMLHIDGVKHDKDDKFANKALLDLYMASSRNLDWFLHGEPLKVTTRIESVCDKKGKTIGAKASFVKKETTYKEI